MIGRIEAMDQTLGRIRKVTTPEGHTDYVFEFPKATGMTVSVMVQPGVYEAQPVVLEWETVSLVELIYSLQR
jgi:hypothetical protein